MSHGSYSARTGGIRRRGRGRFQEQVVYRDHGRVIYALPVRCSGPADQFFDLAASAATRKATAAVPEHRRAHGSLRQRPTTPERQAGPRERLPSGACRQAHEVSSPETPDSDWNLSLKWPHLRALTHAQRRFLFAGKQGRTRKFILRVIHNCAGARYSRSGRRSIAA